MSNDNTDKLSSNFGKRKNYIYKQFHIDILFFGGDQWPIRNLTQTALRYVSRKSSGDANVPDGLSKLTGNVKKEEGEGELEKLSILLNGSFRMEVPVESQETRNKILYLDNIPCSFWASHLEDGFACGLSFCRVLSFAENCCSSIWANLNC